MRRTYDDGWPMTHATTMMRPSSNTSVMTLLRRRTFNDSIYLYSSYIHIHDVTSDDTSGQTATDGIWYTWVKYGKGSVVVTLAMTGCGQPLPTVSPDYIY